MSTRLKTFSPMSCLIPALAGLILAVHTTATAAVPGKTNKAAAASTSVTNAPAKQAPIEIPTSHFVIPTTTAEGRNPFFPDSLTVAQPNPAISTNIAAKLPITTLDLKGISGMGNRRFALINNRTFEVGEEADVPIGSTRQKVHVHCITIGEDSVTIEVDGERRELKLRPGI